MRLINADDLIMNFYDWMLQVSPVDVHDLKRRVAADTILQAIRGIEEQPTIKIQKNKAKGMDNMDILVRKIAEGLEDVIQAHPCEWYDLRAAEDVTMKAGELKHIPLGVAIQLPQGYEAILASRSSNPSKMGIIPAIGIGIIDNAYCGDNDEWKFPAYAIRDTVIHKNDRICQFRLLYHNPEAEIKYVDHLNNPDRGGYGSTGIQ